MDKYKKMFQLALDAKENSYSPYSNYKVVAVLETKEGDFITGVNIENSSYGASICAERVALAKGVSQGLREFSSILIYGESLSGGSKAYPCGICRQVLSEFTNEGFEIYITDSGEEFEVYTISDLLPQAFSKGSME